MAFKNQSKLHFREDDNQIEILTKAPRKDFQYILYLQHNEKNHSH